MRGCTVVLPTAQHLQLLSSMHVSHTAETLPRHCNLTHLQWRHAAKALEVQQVRFSRGPAAPLADSACKMASPAFGLCLKLVFARQAMGLAAARSRAYLSAVAIDLILQRLQSLVQIRWTSCAPATARPQPHHQLPSSASSPFGQSRVHWHMQLWCRCEGRGVASGRPASSGLRNTPFHTARPVADRRPRLSPPECDRIRHAAEQLGSSVSDACLRLQYDFIRGNPHLRGGAAIEERDRNVATIRHQILMPLCTRSTCSWT